MDLECEHNRDGVPDVGGTSALVVRGVLGKESGGRSCGPGFETAERTGRERPKWTPQDIFDPVREEGHVSQDTTRPGKGS